MGAIYQRGGGLINKAILAGVMNQKSPLAEALTGAVAGSQLAMQVANTKKNMAFMDAKTRLTEAEADRAGYTAEKLEQDVADMKMIQELMTSDDSNYGRYNMALSRGDVRAIEEFDQWFFSSKYGKNQAAIKVWQADYDRHKNDKYVVKENGRDVTKTLGDISRTHRSGMGTPTFGSELSEKVNAELDVLVGTFGTANPALIQSAARIRNMVATGQSVDAQAAIDEATVAVKNLEATVAGLKNEAAPQLQAAENARAAYDEALANANRGIVGAETRAKRLGAELISTQAEAGMKYAQDELDLAVLKRNFATKEIDQQTYDLETRSITSRITRENILRAEEISKLENDLSGKTLEGRLADNLSPAEKIESVADFYSGLVGEVDKKIASTESRQLMEYYEGLKEEYTNIVSALRDDDFITRTERGEAVTSERFGDYRPLVEVPGVGAEKLRELRRMINTGQADGLRNQMWKDQAAVTGMNAKAPDLKKAAKLQMMKQQHLAGQRVLQSALPQKRQDPASPRDEAYIADKIGSMSQPEWEQFLKRMNELRAVQGR